ncbi:MAG: ATP-dependent helicase [Patescibacteria group bacterium]
MSINYHDDLNPAQLSVVTNGDGPCLVLAGAGSGKTRTITYRVAYLLEKGVQPENILLVTFTNKAAKAMIERVETLHATSLQQMRLPWAGTFHHIGFRILKRYAALLGYKNNFTILDSADSLDLLKLCLKQEGIDRKERRFPSPSVLQAIISYARNAETTIEDVLDLKHPKFLEIADTITRIAEDYRKKKIEANAMDFDDLLVNWHLLLLKFPNVKQSLALQFQYVLVDEYQDTNKIQASIIRLLASHHKNILVVGDDAQSIYSFRAANIENILSFEKEYPNAKIFKLETNYRSTPEILNMANAVIAGNVNQYEKELVSVRESFAKPEIRAFADQMEEASFITTRILELRDEGIPFAHIAVLFRAAFHSQALEMELARRHIPYEYRGGVRFFERAHVKDVLAYLRAFHNPSDIVAWSRVLNMQVGIGPAAAEMIIEMVKKTRVSPTNPSPQTPPPPASPELQRGERGEGTFEISSLGSTLPARAQIGFSDFLQVWEALVNAGEKTADMIRAVIRSKYKDYLENEYPDYRDRVGDLEQLALFAERAEDVHSFLAEASLQENFTRPNVETRLIASLQHEQPLVLSTIHQAKGLEWEAVFVLNVAEGAFPNDMSLRAEKELEEERRLFYVAITRAKKYLAISYPLMAAHSYTLSGPSMFLQEIEKALIDEHEYEGESLDRSGLVFRQDNADSEGIVYIREDEPVKKKPPKSFLIDV